MQQTHLRHILFKYVLLVGAIPLVLTILLTVNLLIPRVQEDLHTHQQQLARAIATQVESYLATSHATVLNGAGLHVHDLDRHNIKHVQHVLETNVSSLPHLRALYLVDSNGRILTAATARGTEQHLDDLLNLDLSRNPLVAKVLNERKEQWSDTFLSVVGGGLTVALAIPSGDRIMVGEFELVSLSKFLKQIDPEKKLDIFVLDRRGQVIADQAGHFTAQQLNLSNIPLVQHGLKSSHSLTGTFEFGNKKMVGSLQRVANIDWTVMVAQPRSVAYGQLLATGGITAAGIFTAMATGLAIALTLARSLSKRFEQLADHARHIAEDTQTGPWPHSNITEFTILATNLQHMSERLHERARLLEDEIAERQKAEEALHAKTLLLQQEVDDRMFAEQQLQVKQTQLEALNITLERRVQDELAKNREKDAIMIQQGRLAAMGEMLSNIAHQWRQPLNELAIMIQMLPIDHDDHRLDEERLDVFVRECMQTIDYMSQTINTFRDFLTRSQPSSSFNPSIAITETINLLRASLQSAQIAIHFDLEQDCQLTGYKNDLSQVILNLCNNARDTLIERATIKPQIFISLHRTETDLIISVEDNAGGVNPDIIDKIFEPYFTTKQIGRAHV